MEHNKRKFFYYLFLPIYDGRGSLIFETKFLIELLSSPETENHVFSCWSVRVFLLSAQLRNKQWQEVQI